MKYKMELVCKEKIDIIRALKRAIELVEEDYKEGDLRAEDIETGYFDIEE